MQTSIIDTLLGEHVFKKFGMVTVGVTAGLLAAAPLATAGESHGHHGDDHKRGGSYHETSERCTISGGNAEAEGVVIGESVADGLVQAPVGTNALNFVCSDILNDNLSGNSISLNVLGEEAPEEDEGDTTPAPDTTPGTDTTPTPGDDAGDGAGADAAGIASGAEESLAL